MADGTRPTPALAGVAAAAVALGVTGLLAVLFGPASDARTAVGSAVIDLTPGPVREWAITTFGTADKTMLTVLILGIIAGIAALTTTWETGRIPVGSIAIGLGGVAGCAAVLSRTEATWPAVVPTIIGTLCGIAVLRLLVSDRLRDKTVDDGSADPGWRRSLVALGLLAAGAVTGVGGVVLSRLASS